MSRIARILVLEDDENFRELLADVLSDEGFEVTAVDRGEAAVQLAASEAFDLIIADIKMEGMSGLEALERTQQLQPNIGSVIVSGYASELETAQAEHLDIGAYIHKPFKMQDLLQHVRTELASRSLQQKEAEKKKSFRLILDWTLTRLCQAIDETGSVEGSLSKAAELAERMCRTLGCEDEVRLSTRWAVILAGVNRVPGEPMPSIFQQAGQNFSLLGKMLTSLASDDVHQNSPEELQTAAIVLGVHFPDPEERDKSRDDRLARQKSRVSPLVWSAYEQSLDSSKTPESVPLEVTLGVQNSRSNQRSLVSLGLTLERLGDRDNAMKAYTALVAETIPDKERLQGFLGLTRLAAQSGDKVKLRNGAIAALKLAKLRGPSALAHYGLEAALLLERAGAEEADEALTLVGQAARTVSFPIGISLARCALSKRLGRSLESTHVEALVSPVSATVLSRYVDWFIPFLFERVTAEHSHVLSPALARVASDFQPRFLYWFEPSRCPAESRKAVARILLQTRFLSEQIVNRLAEDPDKTVRQIGAELKLKQQGKKKVEILRIQSFGLPTLFQQGESLEESVWRTRKVKYLFFLLASRWGQPVTEDELLETFWPNDLAKNKKNLYWANSRVRSMLKNLLPDTAEPLIRKQNTLALQAEIPRWHDLEEFSRAADLGLNLHKTGDLQGALEYLRIASNAYIGPYLDGCYLDFAVKLKDTTEQKALAVNLAASEIYLEQNQESLALEHATNAVELAPYHQKSRACAMRAQIRLGQATNAMNHFQEVEKILQQDYGTEPSMELLELYHRARLGYTDA